MTRTSYPSDKLEQFMVRFPPGMREAIRASAQENGRSMNAEVIARLEQSFRPGAHSDPQSEDMFVRGIVSGVIDSIAYADDPVAMLDLLRRKGSDEGKRERSERLQEARRLPRGDQKAKGK